MSFFQKIQHSDIFVILGNCQFERGGFQNRFNHNDRFYSMQVNKGIKKIAEKLYIKPQKDWEKITTAFPKLKIFDDCVDNNLLVMNSAIIMKACDHLGIKTPIIPDYPTSLTGTERLVDICVKLKATKYLSGVSGKNYLNMKLFWDAGIEVIFQDDATMDKRALVEVI